MDKKGIAVLTMLALTGMGMAFAFVGLMVSGTSHEDVWTYQQPMKEKFTFTTLTEDLRQRAIEIAKQNETVKQCLEQGYEIIGVGSFGNISKSEKAIVYVTLRKDKELVSANVDLDEEKITTILRSKVEIAELEIQEVGRIKTMNETETRIVVVSGRERKQIKAPEVRELTEEEREEAKEITLSDPEVQNIINGMNYTIEIKPMGMIIINEVGEVETEFDGASVSLRLEVGTIYFVHVDLENGKVIRTSPPIPPPETSGKKVDE